MYQNFKLLPFFSLLAVLSFSCDQQKKDAPQTGIVHVPIPSVDYVDFDTLYCVERVIVPEWSDDTDMKNVERVFWSDSVLVIFDSRRQRIQTFDKAGKYLNDVGRQGNGDGEYAELKDVIVTGGKVYAYDAVGRKMLVFSLDGSLEQTIQSAFDFHSFAKAESGFWLYACRDSSNADGYALILVDAGLQKVQAGYFPQNPKFINVERGSNFVIHNQDALFFWPTSNVIYRLKGDEVAPYVTIDFGENTPNYVYLSRLGEESVYVQYMEDNRCYRFRSVHACNDFMTFVYRRYADSEVTSPNFAYYNRLSGNSMASPAKMSGENPVLRASFNIGETDDCLILMTKTKGKAEVRNFLADRYGIVLPQGNSNPAFLFCRPMLE